MYELMQTRQYELLRSKALHVFKEEALEEYARRAQFKGAMYLEQSDRPVESQMYQWESSAGMIEEPKTLLLAFVLEQLGRITADEAVELVELHFDNQGNEQLPDFAYQEEFDGEMDEEEEEEEMLLLEMMSEMSWELIAFRDHALKLTYIAYDQYGADGGFNHTTWITSNDFRDICVDTENIFKRAEGREFEDYDMVPEYVNPIRGGGFSCTN